MKRDDMRPGELPPGAHDELARALASFRASEIVNGVQVLSSGCPVAEAVADIIFPLDRPPVLPFAGCTRDPCCACTLIAVLDDEAGASSPPVRLSEAP